MRKYVFTTISKENMKKLRAWQEVPSIVAS